MSECAFGRGETLSVTLLVVANIVAYYLPRQFSPQRQSIEEGSISEFLHYYTPAARVKVTGMALFCLAVVLPLIGIVSLKLLKNLPPCDLPRSLIAFLGGLACNTLLADTLKVIVGRPRPDFFGRCYGNEVLENISAIVKWQDQHPGFPECTTADEKVIEEGYKSFPSGHAALAFFGLSQLSWNLVRSLHYAASSGQWRTCGLWASCLPLLVACWIAATRQLDKWHWSSDILVGSAMGLTLSVVAFSSQFGPWWWSIKSIRRRGIFTYDPQDGERRAQTLLDVEDMQPNPAG